MAFLQLWGILVAIVGNLFCNFVPFHFTINKLMNDKIKAAIDATNTAEAEVAPVQTTEHLEEDKKAIILATLELEAFFLNKRDVQRTS